MYKKINSRSVSWTYNDISFLVKLFSEVYINYRSNARVETVAKIAQVSLKDKDIRSIISKINNINTTYKNMGIHTTYNKVSKITNIDIYKQIISSYMKNHPLKMIE